MNSEILEKVDGIIELLEKDGIFDRFNFYKNKASSKKSLTSKIEQIKTSSEYDDNYISTKKEIIDDTDYMQYKVLEKDIFFLVQEINKRLNSLIKE